MNSETNRKDLPVCASGNANDAPLSTPEIVQQALAICVRAFPKFDLRPDSAALYAEFLRDLPPQALQAATLQLVAESRYFPTISEIRAKTRELFGPPRRTAEEAWGVVVRLRTKDRDANFDGEPDVKIILEALRVFDGRLHECTNMDAARARFCKAYESIAARVEAEAKLLPQVQALIAPKEAGK